MADNDVEVYSKSVFGNIRQPQKRAFLRAYVETGRITEAIKAIGMDRDIHYHWMKDEAYAQAFAIAQVMAGNKFEDEVRRRAFEGDERGVYHKGEKIGSYRIFSDLLAIFTLKGIFPNKYRDNQPGLTFQGPTQINVTIKNVSLLPTPQDFITCDAKKTEED